MDAKIATISVIPKIVLLSLIKIVVRYLKISVRYLKISVLKIAVHSLKIAGLKIIARVCVYVCAWVRGCAPYFAEVSKMAQDAPEPEHKHQSDHRKPRSTSAPSARV